MVNRRFLLIQGEAGKPRTIDDCKTSGRNSAYTQNKKLVLQDLDAYIALCAFVGSSVKEGAISMKMSDGSIKTASVVMRRRGGLFLFATMGVPPSPEGSFHVKCGRMRKEFRRM